MPLEGVDTDTLRMTGTRMSGCVLRQNDKMETQIKNTDMTPII